MSAAATGASGGQSVDVTDLDVPQLIDVRKQLEQELQHLTSSYGQLKAAQSRFRVCIQAIEEIEKQESSGKPAKEMLIPLTSSLYVPGSLASTEKVVVDVGTGYYIERSTADAKNMYSQRVDFVAKNLETLQETITRKEDNMRVVREIILVKATQQQQQQQNAG